MMDDTSVPILMYHQVSPEQHPAFKKYTVTPRAFAAQMKWLAVAGYTPIDLDALVASRRGQKGLPPRPIVITFDDGFHDCIEYAVPILQRHRFTAVFYAIAGLMGQTGEWLRHEMGIELQLMDWSDARRLIAAGFQCGSHTVSHPHLPDLSMEACRYELRTSRQMLEDQLGCDIRHLAYPFGRFDARVQAVAREVGYHSACSARTGRSQPDDDLLALHRVPVTGHDSLFGFIWRLRSGYTMSEILYGQTCRALEWLRLRKTESSV